MSRILLFGLTAVFALAVVIAVFLWPWDDDPNSSSRASAPGPSELPGPRAQLDAPFLPISDSKRIHQEEDVGAETPDQINPGLVSASDPVVFDAEAGPYSVEYFNSLSLEEVLTCRRALGELQTEEIGRFLKSSAAKNQTPLTIDDYIARGLEGAEDIYVPDYGVDGIESLRFYYVNSAEFPRIYALRERARTLQSSIPFKEDLLARQNALLEKLEMRTDISDLQVVTSPDGTYFTVYGTLNGQRKRVGQVSARTSF